MAISRPTKEEYVKAGFNIDVLNDVFGNLASKIMPSSGVTPMMPPSDNMLPDAKDMPSKDMPPMGAKPPGDGGSDVAKLAEALNISEAAASTILSKPEMRDRPIDEVIADLKANPMMKMKMMR